MKNPYSTSVALAEPGTAAGPVTGRVRAAVSLPDVATEVRYLDTAGAVAATGVDFISVGGLTHSAPILDIALDLRES